MIGFSYESDQDALKKATDNLEKVVEDELLAKIDDLIDSIDDIKSNTNVYDVNGVLLGDEYKLPVFDELASMLSLGNGSNIISDALNEAKRSAYDEVAKVLAENNGLSLSIGEINVSEVDNGAELASAIVEQFPNALLQALYNKTI